MPFERWLIVLRMRLRSLVFGQRADRDVDEELQEHVARQIEQNVAGGMTPAEARTAALRALGGIAQRQEEIRDTRRIGFVTDTARDVTLALRAFVRRPAFAASATLLFALGIGAASTMYATVKGVLLQPLPFPEPDRLLLISSAPVNPRFGRLTGLSNDDFLTFKGKRNDRLLEAIATFGNGPANLNGTAEPVRINRSAVSPEFFDVLRVHAALGQRFSPASVASGGTSVVVLGDRLWRSHFASAADAVGRQVRIDGTPHTVIGVMPAGFTFPDDAEAWTPLEIRPSNGNSLIRPVIGRLKPGATREQVQAELETMTRPTDAAPGTWSTIVVPLAERIVGDVRTPLGVMAAAVGFVLLIACLNVANLFLVRTGERDREMAVRSALGAGRLRLVRQLAAECLTIGAAGAAAGLALAYVATSALVAWAPARSIPRAELVRIDSGVAAFAVGLGLLTAAVFGLLPAFRATRWNTAHVAASRTSTGRLERFHGALVIAEVALAVLLLTGAGLMLRTVVNLRSVDTGFTPAKAVVATVDLPSADYRTADRAQRFQAAVLDNLSTVSGVESAGVVNWLPLGTMSISGDVALDGGRTVPQELFVKPCVSSGYFRAMGIRLVAGRAFTDQDNATAQPVAVVSASAARLLWPGEDPLGQRVSLRTPVRDARDWLTVVGVVDDVRQEGLTTDKRPAVYQSYLQVQSTFFLSQMNVVVRAAGDSASLSAPIRNAVRRADPDLPPPAVVALSTFLSARTASQEFQARLLSSFAVAALVLTVAGIYGVLAFAVSRRTRELGIRVALGAGTGGILRMVLGRALVLAGVGAAIGTAGALSLTRLLDQLLFGVSPTDPSTLTGVVFVLVAAALSAAAIPAWRAARVDPTIALKSE